MKTIDEPALGQIDRQPTGNRTRDANCLSFLRPGENQISLVKEWKAWASNQIPYGKGGISV
jgi:hypothetical protein